jgi:Reverse transcriptase (RNA-dependent DNA polymerase)
MVLIDLEKVYDKIPRNIMWWTLEKKIVPTKYAALIKDMYTNVVTNVRACDGKSKTFPIKIELHQVTTLNSYIFTLVMNEVMKDTRRHP